MWFRPPVSPASEASAGFEKHEGLLHRGHTGKCPTPWCKASKPHALHVAQELHWCSQPVHTSFPTPAGCQPSKTIENGFYLVLLFPGCGQAGHGEEPRSLAAALPTIASACRNALIE